MRTPALMRSARGVQGPCKQLSFYTRFAPWFRGIGRTKQPSPASAGACLDCVRRVHKHSEIAMCPAPSVALMLRGLVDEYAHIHGAECLVPHRREPLINEQKRAILTIAPRTKLGARVVDWASPLFVNFADFFTTLRQSGSRKADLISVTPEEFGRASMARWNLK